MAGRLSHFGLAFGSFRLGVQAILAACWGHFGLAKLDDVAHGGCVCVCADDAKSRIPMAILYTPNKNPLCFCEPCVGN